MQDLLERAGRAPSGGNLQPWRVHALAGEPLRALVDAVRSVGPDPQPGYSIYPENLWEPYRTRRFACGEALYAALSIPREDKAGRLAQLARNQEFFGAPVGVFLLIDRDMGPPQWADLGIYLQTLMLLAVEQGLDTCAQEFWALHAATVEARLEAPAEQRLFCGLALGYRDDAAPVNAMRITRAPFEEWGKLHGF